MDTEASDEIEI